MDAAHRSRFSINQCMDRCRVTKMRSSKSFLRMMEARVAELERGSFTDNFNDGVRGVCVFYGAPAEHLTISLRSLT